jgi:hypothetical protein
MNKYEELCRLGRLYAVDTRQVQLDCRLFANSVIKKMAAYLAIPPGAMVYRDIDNELCWGERKLTVAASLPELRYIDDGFWYFAVEFELMGNSVIDRFAVKKSGDNFVVRHDQGNHELDPALDADFDRFFEYWYTYMTKTLSASAAGPPATIGFYASN